MQFPSNTRGQKPTLVGISIELQHHFRHVFLYIFQARIHGLIVKGASASHNVSRTTVCPPCSPSNGTIASHPLGYRRGGPKGCQPRKTETRGRHQIGMQVTGINLHVPVKKRIYIYIYIFIYIRVATTKCKYMSDGVNGLIKSYISRRHTKLP